MAGALNYIGVSAAAIGQDIKNFFSVDYDGSWLLPASNQGHADQIAGALRAAFNDPDTTVAYWLNDFGYNTTRSAPALQSAYNDADLPGHRRPGLDRRQPPERSSMALRRSSPATGATTSPPTTPGTSTSRLFMDVSGGSQSPNGGVIQWPWDGGTTRTGTWSHSRRLGRTGQPQQRSVPCRCTTDSTNAGQHWSSTLATAVADQMVVIGSGVWPGPDVNGWTATIESMSSGLFADVYGASGSEGTGLDQWYWNGGWNQSWHFSQAIG